MPTGAWGAPCRDLPRAGGIDLRTTPRAHLSVVTRAGAPGSAHLGALPSCTRLCLCLPLCARSLSAHLGADSEFVPLSLRARVFVPGGCTSGCEHLGATGGAQVLRPGEPVSHPAARPRTAGAASQDRARAGGRSPLRTWWGAKSHVKLRAQPREDF